VSAGFEQVSLSGLKLKIVEAWFRLSQKPKNDGPEQKNNIVPAIVLVARMLS
jgi:hypothetical protein